MQVRHMPSCGVCVSRSYILSKRIKISSNFFFTVGYPHHASFFTNQTGWRYSDGNPPNWGVECRWGRQKSRFRAYIWPATSQVLSTGPAVDHGVHRPVAGRILRGIRLPNATRDNQSPSSWFYGARPTKRALALYTITVDREWCVWQQGWTLRRRQQNRIELFAPLNPKPK